MESIVAASVSQSQPSISATSPWASLPTDLLLDLSGRLHDARDFLRFHAVCRAWRDAAAAAAAAAPSPAANHTFLPWLISQPYGSYCPMHTPVIYSGSVSSEDNRDRYKGNALAAWSSFSPPYDTAWVASADGEAVWNFSLMMSPKPSLTDLLLGTRDALPLFPDDIYEIERRMRKPRGIVYTDGTVLLYSFVPEDDTYGTIEPVFTAAILRPGDMAWTIVEKSLDRPVDSKSCAAYHDGKVLVWVGALFWPDCFWCFVVTQQDAEADGGDSIAGVRLDTMCDSIEEEGVRYCHHNTYLLESRGQLFSVSLLIDRPEGERRHSSALCDADFVVPTFMVMVHALQQDGDDNIGKFRWVERDARSLGDRVLFLGIPASFTMDATQLGIDGGCAYLVYRHRVFRYNLVDGETQHVDCPCLGSIPPHVHVWLRPQPPVTPIHDIQERLRLLQKKKN